MKLLRKIICFFKGHDWQNDNGYPTRGWRNEPNKDSYCRRCKLEVHYK